MEEIVNQTTVDDIRTNTRANLTALRKDKSYCVLKQKRLNLSDVENFVKILTLEEFKIQVSEIKCKKPHINVLKTIKNYSCYSAYTEAFLRIEGAFDALIRILIGNDGQKQLEAAACLGNISCTSIKASVRVSKQAGAYIVSYILGGSHFLQSQCAWAAGNIAGQCFESFAILQSQGVVPALLGALGSSSSEVIESAVYAMNFCTSYKTTDKIHFFNSDIVQNLIQILHDTKLSEFSHVYAGLTLANILCMSNHNIVELINKNEIDSVISYIHKEFVGGTNITVMIPLIRCLGYVSTSYEMCEFLSQHPIFHAFIKQVIEQDSYHLKKEVLWILTNIAVNSTDPLIYIDVDSIFKLIQVFLNPLDKNVLQVLYYICILAAKSEEMCTLLHQRGTVSYMRTFSECRNDELINATNVLLEICK